MKNVLIIATHGLGDLVMLLPVLKSYDFTGLQVTMLLKGKAEQDLLLSTALSFKVDIFLLSKYDSIRKKINLIRCLHYRTFSYIYPQAGVSRAKYTLLFVLVKKARYASYYTFLRYLLFHCTDRSKHKALVNHDIFGLTNLKYNSRGRSIYPDLIFSNNEDVSFIGQPFLGCKKILISPGSGNLEAHKRWSRDKYVSLIDRLLGIYNDVAITVVGSSSELELISYIESRCASNIRLTFQPGTLSISQLLLLITKADLVLSNCNGVSHLSALCQTHVVGLYGPTDPEFTGPFGVSFDSVSLNLDCSPCYNRNYMQGCGNPVCMNDIPLHKVANAINNHLDKVKVKEGN
jgi:heptosyltransferase II